MNDYQLAIQNFDNVILPNGDVDDPVYNHEDYTQFRPNDEGEYSPSIVK